ncbi:MAG: VanZ family protein [Pseudomonadota bacterium]
MQPLDSDRAGSGPRGGRSRRTRRRTRVWLVVASLGALILLQQFASLSGGTRLLRALQDAAHVPWFFAIALLLAYLVRRRHPLARVALVVICGAAIALATEALQTLVLGRSASVADLYANALGGLLGLVFSFCLWPWPPGLTRSMVGVTLVLLTIGATIRQPLDEWRLREYRLALAPRLVDFGDPRTRTYLATKTYTDYRIGRARDTWAERAGQPVLRVAFGDDEYPTLYIDELLQNWRGYDSLVLDLFLPGGDPLRFVVGVRYEGASGTTAYFETELQPGATLLRVPRDRLVPDDAVNVRVDDLLLYSFGAQHAGRALLLADIYLE